MLDLIKTRGIQITEKDAKFMDLLETPENPLQRGISWPRKRTGSG